MDGGKGVDGGSKDGSGATVDGNADVGLVSRDEILSVEALRCAGIRGVVEAELGGGLSQKQARSERAGEHYGADCN